MISKLHASRPTLTPPELDRVAALVGGRMGVVREGAWRRPARRRAAVVAVLAAGMTLSVSGAALGVSGLALNGDASVAQYGASNSAGTPPSSSGPSSSGSGSGVSSNAASGHGSTPSASTLGVSGASAATSAPRALTAAQRVVQPVATTSGQLPFTGFLAIPMLMLGIALIVAGLLARRLGSRPGRLPPN